MAPGGRRSTTFRCASCSKKYSKKEHLQRHERTHTGARPFQCQICEREFSRGDVLSRHLKVHGSTQPPPWSALQSVTHSTLHLSSEPPSTEESGIQPISPINPAHHLLSMGQSVVNLAQQPSSEISDASIDQNGSSYLLWPDSESFLQTISTWDPMAWDQPVPLFRSGANMQMGDLSGQPQAVQRSSNDGTVAREFPTASTGQRALQAVNGLIRDTLSTVSASADIADLKPYFIDSSLHMFFTSFIPMLPIIHRPTFTFGASAPLLLNAFALGSLFLEADDSVEKGEALWRLAHTALATSWPSMIGEKGEYDVTCGVQLILSAVLSQIYAAFSRTHALRKSSQTFSGLSMHWAQYCGMHNIAQAPDLPSVDDTMETKVRAWKTWVARETQLRALLGICIVDGMASHFSGNPSTTWLTCMSLPLPAHEEAFGANSPDKWILAISRSQRHHQISTRFCDLCHSLLSYDGSLSRSVLQLDLLNTRIVLEILNSMAMESKKMLPTTIGIPSQSNIAQAFAQLRGDVLASPEMTPADQNTALLRWHVVCLEMIASTSRGARRMCYQYGLAQEIFGGEWREESGMNPTRWVNGKEGRKSLLHALAIKAIAVQMPMGAAHDVYLAGAIFSAATTFASFALCGVSKILVPCSIDWCTVLLEGANSQAGDQKTYNTLMFLAGRFDDLKDDFEAHNLVYDLVSLRVLLRSLSLQCGVMQEMEKVVGEWITRCC